LGLKSNKKGNVGRSLFLLLAFIFSLAVSIAIGWYVFSSIRTGFLNMDMVSSNPNATAMLNYGRVAFLNFDSLFVFMIVGLLIANIVAVIQIKTHPLFFFISLLALVIAIVLAAQFSNIFENIIAEDELLNFSADFPIITHFMDYYPMYFLVMGILILIIVYAKYRWAEGYGE
jgi:flagellar biosynthesis protein FliQ